MTNCKWVEKNSDAYGKSWFCETCNKDCFYEIEELVADLLTAEKALRNAGVNLTRFDEGITWKRGVVIKGCTVSPI